MRIKIVFVLLVSLLNANAFAKENHIISCDRDASVLSNMFAQNWEANPARSNYFSYVIKYMSSAPFGGTLHTFNSFLPSDKNPHLSFNRVVLQDVEHYGVWQIDCQYRIGNNAMEDLSDGFLHLVYGVEDTQKCRKVNEYSVSCS